MKFQWSRVCLCQQGLKEAFLLSHYCQILSCQWSVYQKLHNRCSFFTNIVNGLLLSKCPGSSNCTVISHFIFIPPGAKGEHFKSILWLGERVPWEPWQTGNVGWDENLKEDLSLRQAVAKVY